MDVVYTAICTVVLLALLRLTRGRVFKGAKSFFSQAGASHLYQKDRELDGSWMVIAPSFWIVFFGLLFVFSPKRATPGLLLIAFIGVFVLMIPRHLYTTREK